MARSKINYTGRRRGMLTVTEDLGEMLRVKCDCGNEKIIPRHYFFHVESCGCMRREAARKSIVGNRRKIIDFVNTYHTHPNILNTRPTKRNKSGIKGVSLTARGTYVAMINFKGICHYLGTYSTLRDAAKARFAAEEEYFEPVRAGVAK